MTDQSEFTSPANNNNSVSMCASLCLQIQEESCSRNCSCNVDEWFIRGTNLWIPQRLPVLTYSPISSILQRHKWSHNGAMSITAMLARELQPWQ